MAKKKAVKKVAKKAVKKARKAVKHSSAPLPGGGHERAAIVSDAGRYTSKKKKKKPKTHLTKPVGPFAEADERHGEIEEGLMQVVAAVVANFEAAELVQPGE
ncbi:hypothetical protein GC163_17290, partial [bacterium]|nr:hypothetical protein [bacterium]